MTATYLDIRCSVGYMIKQRNTEPEWAPVTPDDFRLILGNLGLTLKRTREAAAMSSADCARWSRLAYAAGVSQSEIARILGVARSSVIDWINEPKTKT